MRSSRNATNARSSKHGRGHIVKRLGLIPRMQEDGTLSSFLLHLARNHAAEPHEFCSMVWPDLAFWPRDLDRTASNAIVKNVARSTGLSEAQIEAMTLQGLVSQMGYSQSNSGIQHGILPVGVYHRIRRRHGQQYCPDCLRSAPTYLRRIWRLEWVISCTTHNRRLQDACWKCDAPFIPHRHNSLLERKCFECEASLSDAPINYADPDASQLQQLLMYILNENHQYIDRGRFQWLCLDNPHEIFDGVRRLCRLLKYSIDGQGLAYRRIGVIWDYLRINEREKVLGQVFRWLKDWPDAFVRWGTTNRISQERLREYGVWPSWIDTEIDRLHSAGSRTKRKPSRTLGILKSMHGNTTAYRVARATFLLDRALA